MADLSGCERQSKTSVGNEERKELVSTGKDLHSFINFCSTFAQGGEYKYYRDSALTYLMKCFTNGDTKYKLIAHINPSAQYADESISTLRFASTIYKQTEKTIKQIAAPVVRRVLKKNSSTSVLESASKAQIPFFTNLKKFIDMNKSYLKDLEEKLSMINFTYNNQTRPLYLKRAAIEYNNHISELFNRNTLFLKKYQIATNSNIKDTARKIHSRSMSQ